jgi:formylglycine-generating enzyme required for sulfatase activity
MPGVGTRTAGFQKTGAAPMHMRLAVKSARLVVCLLAAVACLRSSESNSDEPDKTAPPVADSMLGKKAGEVRGDNGLKMKLVWCPPGKFMLGSPESEIHRFPNSEGQAEVTLTTGFWLGRMEVTQEQWVKVMETTPWKSSKGFRRSRFENGKLVGYGPVTDLAFDVQEGPHYPATCLTWEAAAAFCKSLTDQERKAGRLPEEWQYRLPTDAQWEYACRAGTTTIYSFGDDASLLSAYAWWGGRSGRGNAQEEQYAHQVGLKEPNPWGLYDMHGNVSEWCRDWDSRQGVIGATRTGGIDPVGPENGKYRVARGGGWGHDAGFQRSANRFGLEPSSYWSQATGFRVALVRSPRKE